MNDSITTWGGTASRTDAQSLFVVRRPRWHGLGFEVLGWAVVLVGVVTALGDAFSGKPTALLFAGFSVFFICGAGGLLVLCGLLLVSSRVRGYDDHLDVRVGLGRTRRVDAADVVSLRFAQQSAGGGPTFTRLTARNARRRKLFSVFTVYRGYAELAEWLETRCPDAWREGRADPPGVGDDE